MINVGAPLKKVLKNSQMLKNSKKNLTIKKKMFSSFLAPYLSKKVCLVLVTAENIDFLA